MTNQQIYMRANKFDNKGGGNLSKALLIKVLALVVALLCLPYLAGSSAVVSQDEDQIVYEGLEVSKNVIEPGETITVSITVRNTGTAGVLEEAIRFYVDGEVVDSKRIYIPPEDSREVSFTLTLWGAGGYEVTIESAPPKTVSVISRPASFEYSDFKCPGAAIVGESFMIKVKVKNVGSLSGSDAVNLYIDDMAIDSQTVSIDPGAEKEVIFTPTFTGPAVYRIESFSRMVGEPKVWIDNNKNNQYDLGENLYPSIEGAVKDSKHGDWIVVMPVVYDENYEEFPIVVDRPSITIKSAEGPEKTKIVGVGHVGPQAPGFEVVADNVIIEGFTVLNCGIKSDGYWADGEGGGVYIHGAAGVVVKNNIFDNNDACGIWGWAARAIYVCGPNALIENNTFLGFGGIGFRGSNSDGSVARNNVFMGVNRAICLVEWVKDITIENNLIKNCMWAVRNRQTLGPNTFVGNTVLNCERLISSAKTRSLVDWHYNNFVNTSSIIIDYWHDEPLTWDLSYNWWGSPLKPNITFERETETGAEERHTFVKVEPWLGAPVGTEPMPLGYGMNIECEENVVEIGEPVEVTVSFDAENVKAIPMIVTSPFYHADLEPQVREGPDEWIFNVWLTQNAVGKENVKIWFEFYGEDYWTKLGPIPMDRECLLLHTIS